jgi:hypothetical protein
MNSLVCGHRRLVSTAAERFPGKLAEVGKVGEAAFRMTEKGQSPWFIAAGLWPVIKGKGTSQDIFISVRAEGSTALLRNSRTAESGLCRFRSTMAWMSLSQASFWPGFAFMGVGI